VEPRLKIMMMMVSMGDCLGRGNQWEEEGRKEEIMKDEEDQSMLHIYI
jgi:hypothetical protein